MLDKVLTCSIMWVTRRAGVAAKPLRSHLMIPILATPTTTDELAGDIPAKRRVPMDIRLAIKDLQPGQYFTVPVSECRSVTAQRNCIYNAGKRGLKLLTIHLMYRDHTRTSAYFLVGYNRPFTPKRQWRERSHRKAWYGGS